MNNISLPTKINLSDGVLVQEIEGECVLLNLSTEIYYGLDEVGTRFWTLLSENNKSENAVKSLLNEYNVDAETLTKDLSTLINELNEQGLITIEN